MNDAHQVKVAMTNASLFAYVADGHNGLQILQLTSPETMATYAGFSPAPQPQLIATFKTKGPAIAISKGLDRDRAVDESGNQVAVFGRRGARPFTLEEMQRLYLSNGKLRTVLDTSTMSTPPPQSRNPVAGSAEDTSASVPALKKEESEKPSHPPGSGPRVSRSKVLVSGLGGAGLLVFIFGFYRWRRYRLRT